MAALVLPIPPTVAWSPLWFERLLDVSVLLRHDVIALLKIGPIEAAAALEADDAALGISSKDPVTKIYAILESNNQSNDKKITGRSRCRTRTAIFLV